MKGWRSLDTLGADPGVDGGIVRLSPSREVVGKWVMPTDDRAVNLVTLRRIFEENDDVRLCVIEQVNAMPGNSGASMFKFGRVYGYLEAMCAAFLIPYELVPSVRWTKELHAGIEKSLDPKKRSLVAVARLFPSVDLLATEKSKVPHSGLVDGLMLAEYGQRKFDKAAS